MLPQAVIYRHSLATRILHWMSAMCVFLVLMSGLQIFNARPRLYWGQYGANTDPSAVAMEAKAFPGGTSIGVLQGSPQ
jgi:hypothetical protein